MRTTGAAPDCVGRQRFTADTRTTSPSDRHADMFLVNRIVKELIDVGHSSPRRHEHRANTPRPQCRPAPIASGPGTLTSSLNRSVR